MAYIISGTILENTRPVDGVLITDGINYTQSGLDGTYSITCDGTVTITPSRNGYTFMPTDMVVSAGQTLDFEATNASGWTEIYSSIDIPDNWWIDGVQRGVNGTSGDFSAYVYAAIEDDIGQRIYRYDGADYTILGSTINGSSYAIEMAVNPVTGDIYMSTDPGPYISSDGGVTFTSVTDGLGVMDTDLRHFSFDSSGNTFAACYGQWIWKLPVGGSTWQFCTKPAEYIGYNSYGLCIDPITNYVWAALRTGGTTVAIIYSTDGGSSWVDATSDFNTIYVNMSEPTWIYAHDGNIVVAKGSWPGGGETRLAVVSNNSGASWSLIMAHDNYDLPWPYGIAGTGNKIFIVDDNNGLWISEDAGATFNLDATLNTDAHTSYWGSCISLSNSTMELFVGVGRRYQDTGDYSGAVYAQSLLEFVPHDISGTITTGGSPLSGIDVLYDALTPTVTDVDGNYSFHLAERNVSAVAPTSPLYVFDPVSIWVPDSPVDVTGLDFVAHPLHLITFRILDGGGNPVRGVSIYPTDVSYILTTDNDGYATKSLVDGTYDFYYSKAGWSLGGAPEEYIGTITAVVSGGPVSSQNVLVETSNQFLYKWYKDSILVQSSAYTPYTMTDVNALYYAEIWIYSPNEAQYVMAWRMPEFKPVIATEAPVVLTI